MSNTEIKNQLIDIQKNNPDGLTAEIITEVLADTSINPLTALMERVGDLGLKYSIDSNFYITYMDEIQSIINKNLERAKKYIQIEHFTIDASWLAYQITLENILVDLGLFVEDDALSE